MRIDDARGHSFGAGTIIDTHGDEALVLTCGHIFRESDGRGEITVDLYHPVRKSVRGYLLHYDLQLDLGLVSIRPAAEVVPAPVAPPDLAVRPGDPVFSVG